LDVISRVGPDGDYLIDQHTCDNLRSEYYISDLCYRTGNKAWENAGHKNIQDAAGEKTARILDTHKPKTLDAVMTTEINEIMKRAVCEHE
jgi:trimethylamine--corrinoid protein Co-methyltransferase